MRYKVLIVDDEPMIRYGLSSCVAWEEEGLELLGEAANGETALAKLEESMADILITDIKMPLMDGLELIRRVKLLHPGIQAILVSSYSDFAYAREAVKLGVVVDYLLKPTMEPEDLLAIVRTCKARLDEQHSLQAGQSREGGNAEKERLARLAGELKQWLGHGGTPSATQVQLPALSWIPDWMQGPMVAAVWQQCGIAEERRSGLENLLGLEAAMEQCAALIEQSVSLLAGDRQFIVLAADRGGRGQALIEQAHRRLLADTELIFTVGISPPFHHLRSFPAACRWASRACEQAFFEGSGRCYLGKIDAPVPGGNSAAGERGAASEALGVNEGFEAEEAGRNGELEGPFPGQREAFSQAYAEARQEAGQQALDAIYAAWQMRLYSRAAIIAQAQSLLTMLWSRSYKLKSEQMMKEILGKLQGIRQIETLSGLIASVQHEYEAQLDAGTVELVADDTGGTHLIQLALSYIQENYQRELSLQKVADHVHMSKNYFSEQFKRRTGLNYMDFVIRLRIHYAKQLLAETSLRIQDIGAKSGFNSPKHFLKLFKREVGCTPAEYRQRRAGAGEGEGTGTEKEAETEAGAEARAGTGAGAGIGAEAEAGAGTGLSPAPLPAPLPAPKAPGNSGKGGE